MKLLIATRNTGKVKELAAQLGGSAPELISLREFAGVEEVAETGTTFRENAHLKAISYASATGLTALADDSGLIVDALDGRPGVYSARYGGDGRNDHERCLLLLEELSNVPPEGRTARFVCSIVIATGTGEILAEADGVCEGHIAAQTRGDGGFGYDPIFIPDGFVQTFGELPPAIKDKISHRALATRQILQFFEGLAAG